MIKKYSLAAAAFVLLFLSGCGGENNTEYGAAGNHPVYNTEKDFVTNSKDGIIPRLLYGGTGKRDRANEEDYPSHPDNAVYQGDGHSRRDQNYHDHLGKNNKQGGAMDVRSSYYTAYDGKLTERLERAAIQNHNVSTARAAVYQDRAIVAVILFKNKNKEKTSKELERTLENSARGKEVTVVTDPGTYNRIDTLDNELRDGGPRTLVDSDLKDLFQNVRK
ncbi:spore cortex protein [Peribacillus deserti]|uniref:Spore cortex protein n=1 Tax=Peribacillus deserti TaxID=673318 RepID=A0ABS2QFZ8_9BACI|nr:YhcN/YlaJ family sporulation lipoprotein [Peribacillus deserti]MBM7691900.1 spore cortex protein [Peribacillus deserti]